MNTGHPPPDSQVYVFVYTSAAAAARWWKCPPSAVSSPSYPAPTCRLPFRPPRAAGGSPPKEVVTAVDVVLFFRASKFPENRAPSIAFANYAELEFPLATPLGPGPGMVGVCFH